MTIDFPDYVAFAGRAKVVCLFVFFLIQKRSLKNLWRNHTPFPPPTLCVAAMADPRALHGDGINFAFFNLLWSKSDDGAMQVVEPSSAGQGGKAGKISSILRVPDTVVFLFGQPHEWYFTSKNGGPHKNKTTILRKKRVNLTVANIEEVFLTKSASRDVGEDDVVAYFISSKGDGTEQLASLDACNAVADDATSCNIEYLNKQALSKNCIP
jgi:hypothetical protein